MSNGLGKCIGVSLAWTMSGDKFSRLIARVTGGEFSHMLIVFTLEIGRKVYYEALFSKDVTGPHDIEDLENWWLSGEDRSLLIESIPWLTQAQCQAIYVRAIEMKRLAGYGKFQILSHWWMERIGRRYGFRMRNTPHKVTCSEYVTRALYPDVNLMDPIRDHFDAVTPESARQKFNQIKRDLAAAGAFAAALDKHQPRRPS